MEKSPSAIRYEKIIKSDIGRALEKMSHGGLLLFLLPILLIKSF